MNNSRKEAKPTAENPDPVMPPTESNEIDFINDMGAWLTTMAGISNKKVVISNKKLDFFNEPHPTIKPDPILTVTMDGEK